jgi:predicted MFS family arabinose efflux permease
VPPAALASANARIELARTLAFTGGPAIGGALIGWVGAGTAFGAATGLSLVAVMLLAGLREDPRPVLADRKPLRDMLDGLAFVARHSLLRPILLTQFVFSTAFFLVLTIFVPYAVRHLGMTASGIGLTLGFYGAGMVAGAILATAIMRRLPFGIVVGIGPIAGLAASLLMVLTIWVPTPWLAALSLFVFGAGPILWVVSTTTLRQAVTPPPLLGRVSAVSVLTQGARPLGAALAAFIGGMFGAEACLLLAVLGFAAQAAIIWTSPAVGLLRQPQMTGEMSLATCP